MNFLILGMLAVHLSTEFLTVWVNGLTPRRLWAQKYFAAFALEEPWDR